MILELAMMTALATTTPPATIDNEVPVVKVPYKVRHPRIYRCYRGGRKVCIALKPFLDVCAASAQIATPFVIGR